ncbi:hypothetical protein GCM10020358_58730 [Amorphoplanes nipponensis]|uniref:Uncharacterized protein n=1 Tax=Actinoplanes nipponensis TaxID=135950 RepID=A0A919MJP1_9ACTN|nr:hypothetical protein [Actinoplanes nipponensis]GIE46852.1 hypothetical protein Ani05nite_03860 [Actinoplanes nipponensis]
MAGIWKSTTIRGLTVGGLAAGALGIAVLWASGVEFPFYPPPGLLLLASGAAFVGVAKRAWAPGVGAFLGLFVIVGFVLSSVVSGAGTGNLTGDAGIGGVIGTVIQLAGVVTALVAGSVAVGREYRAGR